MIVNLILESWHLLSERAFHRNIRWSASTNFDHVDRVFHAPVMRVTPSALNPACETFRTCTMVCTLRRSVRHYIVQCGGQHARSAHYARPHGSREPFCTHPFAKKWYHLKNLQAMTTVKFSSPELWVAFVLILGSNGICLHRVSFGKHLVVWWLSSSL